MLLHRVQKTTWHVVVLVRKRRECVYQTNLTKSEASFEQA